MRNIIAPAAMILMATIAAPAFGKAHLQPSDTAQMLGDLNASAVILDEDGNIIGEDPTGARNVDAKGVLDLVNGVDGQTFSGVRSTSAGSERGLKAGEMTLPN